MTPKQKRFVEEYLIDLNATAAYRRAGYIAKGNAAEVNASRLLGNAKVAAAVEAARAERSQRTQIDADWVLERLGHEVVADMADLYDEGGGLKQVHEWPLIWRQGLVAGVEAIEERDSDGKVLGIIRKVKLSDRIKRIELIGKHVGVQAFKEKIEHTGEMTLVVAQEDADL